MAHASLLWLFSLLNLLGIVCFLRHLKPSILALQFAFTRRRFRSIWEGWTPADRFRYRLHLLWDLAVLLPYGAIGALTEEPRRFHVARLLVVAASFDFIENALHWILIDGVERAPRALFKMAFAASSLKWIALGLSFCGWALVP